MAPSKESIIMSQLRTAIHEELESLLLVWVKEKTLVVGTVPETTIFTKARVIYGDTKEKAPQTSIGATEDTLTAILGWFENIKTTDIHSVMWHVEAGRGGVK